ncbi:hypothetical protein CAEBREN_05635 [Caenorhabditis brenneri]|uniref:BTB domain-containing protein n=1 Tax=Caenorhabditis brenneri TaxID=135651 RepID=G0MH48_CAEBE|nr:hypothetical protein CAEBREN_05635 [Caenorhabditis brenneri]
MDAEEKSLFLSNQIFYLKEDLKNERERAARAENMLQHKTDHYEFMQKEMEGRCGQLEESFNRQWNETSRMREIANSNELELIELKKKIEKLSQENYYLKKENETLKKSSSMKDKDSCSGTTTKEMSQKEKVVSFEEIYEFRNTGNVNIINTETRFPVHDFVLTHQSTWFLNNIKDKIRRGEKLEFKIDSHPEAAQQLIKFLYVGKLGDATRHFSSLWKFATDFEITGLKKELDILKASERLTFSNVAKEYDVALLLNMENRIQQIKNYLACNPAYFESSEYRDMMVKQKPVEHAMNMYFDVEKHSSPNH